MTAGSTVPALWPSGFAGLKEDGPVTYLIDDEISASRTSKPIVEDVAEEGLGSDHLLMRVPRRRGVTVHQVEEP